MSNIAPTTLSQVQSLLQIIRELIELSVQGPATPTEVVEPTPEKKRTRSPTKAPAVTVVDVKAKLKSVLDSKGRKTAIRLLADFDAEKVGDLPEAEYASFMEACNVALATENDDLDL